MVDTETSQITTPVVLVRNGTGDKTQKQANVKVCG